MKRQISKMIATMVALLFGYAALAAFEPTINDGVLTGFTGDVPANLKIPETVVTIDDGVFEGQDGLISVCVPTNVTYIGESAFAGCTNLAEVTFEDATPVTLESGNVGFAATLEIGAFAFDSCTSLASIIIPAHAETIGESAFDGCTALEWVTFAANGDVSESYLEVCDTAFAGCEALETVTFEDRPYDPDNDVFNLSDIGDGAFEECEALTDLHLCEGVANIGESAFLGIGIEELEIPASVCYIGNQAFADCEYLADVYFAGPDVFGDEYYVEMDEDSVFARTPYGNRFRLDIDGDVVVGYKGEIPEGEGVGLKIPDCVTRIGDFAFEGLEGLISVNIPTNVTYIGESAFAGCTNLEEVVFEAKDAEQVEYSWTDKYDVVHNGTYFGFNETLEIGMNAFAGCTALAFVDIPAHVSAVYEFAFAGCTALEGVVFMSNWDEEQSYLTVCDYAFEGCEALQSVLFEDCQWDPDNDVVNETYINTGVFEGCAALTDLYLGEGVVEIGDSAFSGIGIEELEIPASVAYIGDGAFAGCECLATVSIDGVEQAWNSRLDDVIDIDVESAFEGTPWLEAYLSPPLPGNDNFADAEAVEGMDGEVDGWNIGASIEEGESIGHYDGYSFVATVWYKWTAPESGTFSFGVAGANFDSVIGVYRGSSVGGLATVAFNDDTDADGFGSFTAFDAVAGTTYYIAVGGYGEGDVGTFSLVWAPYEWNVEFEIDENGKLTGADFGGVVPATLTIPEGVTAIADEAFCELECVTTVNLPSMLKSIGAYAFAWCSDLTTVNGLTDAIEVGKQAFLATPFNESRPFGLDVVDGCVVGFHGPCAAKVVVSEGITNVSDSAFSYWEYSRYDEFYDETEDEWYEYEVSSLVNLTAVTLSEDVVSVSSWAFEDCTNLMSVAVGNPEVLIEGSAFAGCTALTAIEVEKAGHTLVGWDLFREKNPGYWSARWDEVGESNIWEYVEKETDIVPTGTVVRVESIETLVYGMPTDAMRTNWVWDAETNDYVVDSVTVVTNYLSGVWATPAWSVNQYTVTFDANGGEGGSSAKLSYGSAISAPTVTRMGYTFAGWSPEVAETVPSADVTYVAQWTPNRYAVVFDANGGTGAMAPFELAYDEAKPLPDCTYDRSAHEFVGWALSADSNDIAYLDGEIVENLSAVDGDIIRLYAIWERTSLWAPVAKDDGSGSGSGSAGDAAFSGLSAEIYDGYVYNASGMLIGMIQAKTAKAKVNKKTSAAQSKVVAVIQLVGEKKQTLKGDMDAAVGVFDAADKSGRALHLEFGANGISGTYGDYLIDGAENKFSSKDPSDKAAAAATLAKWSGVYAVAWPDGTGWSEMRLTVAAKGKVKAAGILANGAKASTTSTLLVGDDGVCMIPVVVTKKVALAFSLWLTPEGLSVVGLPDGAIVGRAGGALKSGAAFHVSKADTLWSSISGTVIADYIPDGAEVTSNGGKWVLPKAGKVVYKNGAVDESKLGENPSGLKLTYKAKDGSFKGSFKVYSVNGAKAKATTVNVTGVVIDGVGYGTATVKGKGETEATIGPVK